MKILLVDDSPSIRAILRDLLTNAGFTVSEAATCREAAQLFEQFRPEIVIKDLFMPEWDAIESIRYFRSRDQRVKIILCSTSSSRATIMEGLKAGAQDFILKPIDNIQVLMIVHRLAVS